MLRLNAKTCPRTAPDGTGLLLALCRQAHAMNWSPKTKPLDHDICVHIFTASAAMVGVCITVIGILHVAVSMHRVDLIGNDLLAVNTILYLLACLLSYFLLPLVGWRDIFLVLAVPAVFVLAIRFFIPESPSPGPTPRSVHQTT